MSRKKRKQKYAGKKKRGKNVATTTILIAAICVVIFSVYQLAIMLIPYYIGGKEYEDVKKRVIMKDETGKEGEEETGVSFQIDFEELLKENSDSVAWIRFDEPSIISYPVVKSGDNQEYLTKTFSANDNKLGAIFMDMRNNKDFTDLNTFIYGHNLKVGGGMFSQLNKYASEDFFKAHPYFYIYTPSGKLTYKIFSAGTVKDIAENYILTYENEKEYTDYLELCRNSSNYQVDVTLDANSRIVSLSTCTNINEDERFLVQGVLVEDE